MLNGRLSKILRVEGLGFTVIGTVVGATVVFHILDPQSNVYLTGTGDIGNLFRVNSRLKNSPKVSKPRPL